MHGEPAFSMGTPRVSGTSRAVKMSAMVCQTPKKTKTPYFIVHIIIRNTCRMTNNYLNLHLLCLPRRHSSSMKSCHIYQA